MKNFVECEILTLVTMEITVFWNMAPCSLIHIHRRFEGKCCLHQHGKASMDIGTGTVGALASRPTHSLKDQPLPFVSHLPFDLSILGDPVRNLTSTTLIVKEEY
jgi:hypothetical protein